MDPVAVFPTMCLSKGHPTDCLEVSSEEINLRIGQAGMTTIMVIIYLLEGMGMNRQWRFENHDNVRCRVPYNCGNTFIY